MLDRRTKAESQELKLTLTLTLLQKRRIPETYAWQNLLHQQVGRREEQQAETKTPHRSKSIFHAFPAGEAISDWREDVYR